MSISTKSRARNVQIPPTAIDARWEDLNTSLHQLQNISLYINSFSTQTLVSMHQVSNQDLDDRKKDINDQYLWSHEKEEAMQREVEELCHAKENLTEDKAQEIKILKRAHEELRIKT